jgi:hypothetical protein
MHIILECDLVEIQIWEAASIYSELMIGHLLADIYLHTCLVKLSS